jgi:hypothetical protein
MYAAAVVIHTLGCMLMLKSVFVAAVCIVMPCTIFT